MELFISDPKLTFEAEKVATAQLSEDVAAWPDEVLRELYKAVPEAADYSPMVEMLKVDEEQGYGFGRVVLKSLPDTSLNVSSAKGSGVRTAVVPIIIKQYMLLPLDVIVTKGGKMYPLSEPRLREALFRPETFDLLTTDTGDTSLYGMLYPPSRAANDFGMGTAAQPGGHPMAMMGPGMKFASLLEAVAPTLRRTDFEKVAAHLADPALQEQMRSNTSFRAGVEKLGRAENDVVPAEKLASYVEDEIRPAVIQFGYDEDNSKYWMRKLSRAAFEFPEKIEFSRREFIKQAGAQLTAKVDAEGTVTLADSTIEKVASSSGPSAVISSPGIYKVTDINGRELVGWVIPNLIDVDGSIANMAVFTNGASAMVQEQIAGSKVSAAADLPRHEPRGTGVFYWTLGGVKALAPVEIRGSVARGEATEYICDTLTGETVRVALIPGLKDVLAKGGGMVALPGNAGFLQIDKEQMTPLMDVPMTEEKLAAYRGAPHVAIHSDGSMFSLDLDTLPKLASACGNVGQLDVDDATVILCAAGLDPADAHGRLKLAQEEGVHRVWGVRDVALLHDRLDSSIKVASEAVAMVRGLRRDLVKEASVLPDIQTVDTVLSLGFINPENVRTFIGRMPQLDRALNVLCELLLSSRLGMVDIPEFAAARAARGLDEVVQGLRNLSMSKPTDTRDPLAAVA